MKKRAAIRGQKQEQTPVTMAHRRRGQEDPHPQQLPADVRPWRVVDGGRHLPTREVEAPTTPVFGGRVHVKQQTGTFALAPVDHPLR
jgi:hypothetical protein